MSANVCIWLSPEDRAELEGWVADRNTPQKLVWRSRIVLLSAAGNGTMSIMRPQALRLDQIRGRNPRQRHPCAKCARTACFRESSVKSATLAFRKIVIIAIHLGELVWKRIWE